MQTLLLLAITRDNSNQVYWNPFRLGRIDSFPSHIFSLSQALLSSGDLLVYHCFAGEARGAQAAPLRLAKTRHGFITRGPIRWAR